VIIGNSKSNRGAQGTFYMNRIPYFVFASHILGRWTWHAPSSRHLRALLSVCGGGVRLGFWGVVLVVCVCRCRGCCSLSVCVCVTCSSLYT